MRTGRVYQRRGLLLIPILQIVGVALTLRLLRDWHRDASSHPRGGRKWVRYVLLPMIPNTLVALTLLILMSRLSGFISLFLPDFWWIALICGSFAALWIFLRTGLVLQTLRKTG